MSESQNWEPISKADLLAQISADEAAMDADLRSFWEKVRIEPLKWSLAPYGGFWVVALSGQQVIWYNDTEDGFDVSTFDSVGTIGQYWCNQDDLGLALRRLNSG